MHYKEYASTHAQGVSITKESERMYMCLLSFDAPTNPTRLPSDVLASVYVHALLAGSGTRTRAEFLEAVHALGGDISTAVQHGTITVTFSCIDTNSRKIMALVQSMLTAPTFLPAEIQRIIEQVCNELLEAKEDAKFRSLRTLINTLFEPSDYRYSLDIDQQIAALKKVTQADIRSFHGSCMQQKWVYSFVSSQQLQKQASVFMTNLQHHVRSGRSVTSKETEKVCAARKVAAKDRVQFVSLPSRQNIEINIGSHISLTQSDEAYFALTFGLAVLGMLGSFSGRLMSTVREKEGLTYGIYALAETITAHTPGYFRIVTFFSPEKLQTGIRSTFREIDQIRRTGITADEYSRFKTILATRDVLLQDSLLRNLKYLHGLQLKGFTYTQIEQRLTQMLRVTHAEVNEALANHLNLETLVISAAGPVSRIKKELVALVAEKKRVR